ncbi:hypothetical protein KC19_4G210500 [Ceratodon purpureus]|uniref:Uncharacterized protein n=1 Tax=Ceratodon purpureus TaxID=3225 RepID=A0A8T0IDC3_CERPU|nr:hypothetical protein KC19_4G210500 [Ceratodon purpureus]
MHEKSDTAIFDQIIMSRIPNQITRTNLPLSQPHGQGRLNFRTDVLGQIFSAYICVSTHSEANPRRCEKSATTASNQAIQAIKYERVEPMKKPGRETSLSVPQRDPTKSRKCSTSAA